MNVLDDKSWVMIRYSDIFQTLTHLQRYDAHVKIYYLKTENKFLDIIIDPSKSATTPAIAGPTKSAQRPR